MSKSMWVIRSKESEEREVLDGENGMPLVYFDKEQALHDTRGMILISGRAFEIAEVELVDVSARVEKVS